MGCLVGLVQTVLHYLGWLGILGGGVAFLFGNRGRAAELVVGGVGFIVLKYVIGFIFVGLLGVRAPGQNEGPGANEE